MKAWLQKVPGYLNAAFCDGGVPSSSRILIAVLVFFILGLTIGFAVSVHTHGITMDQFTNYLVQAGNFLWPNIAALYGINRLGGALDRKYGDPGGPQS